MAELVHAIGAETRQTLGLLLGQGKAEAAVFLGAVLAGWVAWCWARRRPAGK